MYEVRRGAENLNKVKKKDFHLIDDRVYDFKYWKKVKLIMHHMITSIQFSV